MDLGKPPAARGTFVLYRIGEEGRAYRSRVLTNAHAVFSAAVAEIRAGLGAPDLALHCSVPPQFLSDPILIFLPSHMITLPSVKSALRLHLKDSVVSYCLRNEQEKSGHLMTTEKSQLFVSFLHIHGDAVPLQPPPPTAFPHHHYGYGSTTCPRMKLVYAGRKWIITLSCPSNMRVGTYICCHGRVPPRGPC